MTRLIWGAANRGARLLDCLGNENISAFIDSNENRRGKFRGKPIIHPNEIENWKDIFVYVPFNYYDEISELLTKNGLVEDIDFIKYNHVCEMTSDKYQEILEGHLDVLSGLDSSENELIVVFTAFTHLREPHYSFLSKMSNNGINIMMLAEGDALVAEEIKMRYKDQLNMMNLPCFLSPNVLVKDKFTQNEIDSICEIKYVQETVCLIQGLLPLLPKNDCCRYAAYLYEYSKQFLEKIKPKKIVCFGSSIPLHRIMYNMCREYDVSVIFTHEGVIPGTYVFETRGEMGESIPCIYADRFKKLPVGADELSAARRVWDYIYKEKMNRREQTENDCCEYIKARSNPHAPVIFFAGQNDVGSHMVPYTSESRKYHSPIFESSFEAAVFLADLCKKNGWNFVYKPHPYYIQNDLKEKIPSNTIYMEDGNVYDFIDIADVTVTILSITNYNALFRKKPVVMLGYNQIRDKGCTYEAFERSQIETMIIEALDKGFSKAQEESFLLHIAQVLRYYLYDDLQERPIRYGRQVPMDIRAFYELEKLIVGCVHSV